MFNAPSPSWLSNYIACSKLFHHFAIDFIMGATKPIKQWIQRKRNNYKLATGEYLSNLAESIEKDTRERLKKLNNRSVLVEISEPLLQDANLTGVTVSRSSLPDARVGDQVLLRRQQEPPKQEVRGGVISRVNSNEVKIKLNTVLKKGEGGKFLVEFDTKAVLERRKRVECSFWRLKDLSCSLPILKCLLGHYADSSNTKYSEARAFFVKDLAQPKRRQVDAVEQSLKKRIFLVEGPAGSGKTLVAANIACSMTRLRKAKILLCSPIQATVNKLSRLISETDCIRVVQLPSRENEPLRYDRYLPDEPILNQRNVHSESAYCALNTIVAGTIYDMALKRFRRISTYQSVKEMELNEKRAIRDVANCSSWLRKKHERKALHQADVVCCTLLQSGSPLLRGMKFDMLIIDDAHLTSELESIVPMMIKGLRQVTLLGEMRRDILLARSGRKPQEEVEELYEEIDPTSKKPKTLLRRKRITLVENADQIREPGGLFERWLLMGLTSVSLKYQYRMEETIASFSSHHFYLSRSKTDPDTNDKLIRRINSELMEHRGDKFDWLPRRRCLTALFNRQNNENNDIYGAVRDIIQKLGIWDSSIAVVCNIPLDVENQSFCGAQVGQVDEFYGQERDYIIVLALESEGGKETSSNNRHDSILDCDFLKNDLALNIAMTRAQLGLFIVADIAKLIPHNSDQPIDTPDASSYCKSWLELVKYYSASKLLVH